MARFMYALIAISFCTLCGCSGPKQATPGDRVAPTQTVVQPPASGPHVRLSLRDMTLELDKHCTAANKGFRELASLANSPEADRNPSAVIAKIREQVPKIQDDVGTCMTMVHGMEEQHLGEPADGKAK